MRPILRANKGMQPTRRHCCGSSTGGGDRAFGDGRRAPRLMPLPYGGAQRPSQGDSDE